MLVPLLDIPIETGTKSEVKWYRDSEVKMVQITEISFLFRLKLVQNLMVSCVSLFFYKRNLQFWTETGTVEINVKNLNPIYFIEDIPIGRGFI